MGLQCDLKWIYSFIYNKQVENNLIEHELDYVFIGYSNQDPVLNKDEVQDYKWMYIDEILSDIKNNPSHYTIWFKQAFPELLSKVTNENDTNCRRNRFCWKSIDNAPDKLRLGGIPELVFISSVFSNLLKNGSTSFPLELPS